MAGHDRTSLVDPSRVWTLASVEVRGPRNSFRICTYVTDDSKRLPRSVSPFDSAATKNRGRGACQAVREWQMQRIRMGRSPNDNATSVTNTSRDSPRRVTPQLALPIARWE